MQGLAGLGELFDTLVVFEGSTTFISFPGSRERRPPSSTRELV